MNKFSKFGISLLIAILATILGFAGTASATVQPGDPSLDYMYDQFRQGVDVFQDARVTRTDICDNVSIRDCLAGVQGKLFSLYQGFRQGPNHSTGYADLQGLQTQHWAMGYGGYSLVDIAQSMLDSPEGASLRSMERYQYADTVYSRLSPPTCLDASYVDQTGTTNVYRTCINAQVFYDKVGLAAQDMLYGKSRAQVLVDAVTAFGSSDLYDFESTVQRWRSGFDRGNRQFLVSCPSYNENKGGPASPLCPQFGGGK